MGNTLLYLSEFFLLSRKSSKNNMILLGLQTLRESLKSKEREKFCARGEKKCKYKETANIKGFMFSCASFGCKVCERA